MKQLSNGYNHPAFDKNIFRFCGKNSVLNERDLGIAGPRMTVLTPERAACEIRGIQNCPWSGSGFSLEVRMNGERINGRDWDWLPNMIRRHGENGGWEAKTVTYLPPDEPICLLRIAVTNHTGQDEAAPIQLIYAGSARKENSWVFRIPGEGGRHPAQVTEHHFDDYSVLFLHGTSPDVSGGTVSEDDAQISVFCSLPDMTLFSGAGIWETTRMIADGETFFMDIAVRIGEQTDSMSSIPYDAWTESSFAWLDKECERITSKLPRFSSDDPLLDAMYYRSVVTYSLNRWENPALVTVPFYSTGSITGGCMCSYLWDYSGGMMLHPLIDPETNYKMICAYLHADLCNHYAITPLDGSPTGPWYHINQEKVIGMIYFHVLHTGDMSILSEVVDGKTVLEWAKFHAMVGDDPTKPVSLIDYGKDGESHLELRRQYVYQGVMPDLNARRYMNYLRAYRLTEMAGCADPWLLERANGLKQALQTLWDEDAGWYDFIWNGNREKRYTVQMFKFFSSPVIDDPMRRRLADHLNEREFLSKFGLHSMSKTDPAYDQIDIDNGGGGICMQFTMHIALQLYEAGYDALATDLLQRVRWIGTRLPYLGDSVAANMLLDREDTPLQADISSASCAQAILFGICGISVQTIGSITVCPPKIRPVRSFKMQDIRISGIHFSVIVDDNHFQVIQYIDEKERHFSGIVGKESIILRERNKKLRKLQ